ncbi:aspartyl protease family protein [Mucilaginibacter jinjuensis]|uniref:Aspartyl protease family protein n=1 Tax=Mucilaginibacter jinjuensis TaxID=1176721 RepID=A0ABY7T759_9SPHI|nr:aspartyl protease family protein [Mucilaginibacter jinjuensis]WCT12226.1 aspartyl protease family protein [Mucilaginibacter jinjuensis]
MLVLLFAFSITGAKAQFFDLPPGKKKMSVPFKMVRNMVIVKTKIDGKGPFNFIIDSGVGIIIITDPSLADSIGRQSHRTIKLSGLGEGEDFDAMVSSNLKFDIDGIRGNNLSAAILKKDHFGLSNYAGMQIHGLIGYDFFNSLAVKFNFFDSTMTVARSGELKELKKGFRIPITIEQGKPYMQARVKLMDQTEINAKLVIDLGAGHPLMLDNQIKNNSLPQKFIVGNLGVGLTGPVSGLISRVSEVDIGKYAFKNVITSFTLTDTASTNARSVARDGNLGLGILKRFTLIIDYQNNAMFLKPGKDFKNTFEHDMSGLEYYADGNDLHAVIINRVEPGSAGDLTGLQKDDIILNINFKPVADMSIQEIDDLFKSGPDRSLLLDIYRDKKRYRYILTLKRRL